MDSTHCKNNFFYSSANVISHNSNMLPTRGLDDMADIPNKLSFIWVGEAIPHAYAKNIILWAQLNPRYQVNLWTQKHLLSTSAQRLLTAFREMTGGDEEDHIQMDATDTGFHFAFQGVAGWPTEVNLERINTLQPLVDPSILQEELTEWKNFGQVSDFLRLEVLHSIGGIYMDLDTQPNGQPMPLDIVAPYGILMCGDLKGDYLWLLNAIMASPAKNEQLETIAANMEKSYFGEYDPIGGGVARRFVTKNRQRFQKLGKAREVLQHPEEFSGLSRRRAKNFMDYEFVGKTTSRVAGALPGVIPYDVYMNDRYALSFQHQSGYHPVVGADASWHH